MKIPLVTGQDSDLTGGAAQDKALERDILATQRGDWTARQNMAKAFLPLISSLAQKRSSDPTKRAELVSAGKEGVIRAARKYRREEGPHQFRIQAAAEIEQAMERAGSKGFLARLFGR
jgi:DNA-directed RNA polymerase specialized sigma subunit